jgi:hypothetical protein
VEIADLPLGGWQDHKFVECSCIGEKQRLQLENEDKAVILSRRKRNVFL